MAESIVKLIVDATQGVRSLGRFKKATAEVEGAVLDANGRLRDAKGRFIASGNAADKASLSFGNLSKKLVKAAAAYATLRTAQAAVSAGIQRVESERRIKFLAQSYGEVAKLTKAASDASERFGVSQTTANQALAQVFARLRPVGVSLEDIVSTYNGFNTAARISGATSVEASNAFTQLAQALGSGALRGDEFNSISEQVPGILTAISKESGVAQGQLRKFAAEGGITAEIVISALKRIETEGVDQLNAALGGPSQAIANFQNATEDVQVALTQEIIPQISEAFRGLAELILNLEPAIKFIGGLAAGTLNQINSLIVAATKPGEVSARRDIESGLLPLNVQGAEDLFRGTGPDGTGFKGLQEQSIELAKLRNQGKKQVLLQLMKDRLNAIDLEKLPKEIQLERPASLLLPSGNNKGTGRTGPDPVEEARKLAQLSRDRVQAFENQALLASAVNETERKNFQLNIDIAELQKNAKGFAQEDVDAQIAARIALENKRNEAEAYKKTIAETAKEEADSLARFLSDFDAAFQELDAKAEAQGEKMDGIYKGIGDSIQGGVVDALTAAVDGTKSLAEVASATLKDIGNMFIKLGINQLFNSLGSGGGILGKLFGSAKGNIIAQNKIVPFAKGGIVGEPTIFPLANGTGLMGEAGPEAIMPLKRGPSGRLGVEVASTREQLNNQQAATSTREQLDRQQSAASTREQLNNQQAVAMQPLDIRYESTVINNVEYVTAEQHRQGMAQAAERGRAMTLTTLQNSPRTRSKVGI
jgi:tape measure domain-containing protein